MFTFVVWAVGLWLAFMVVGAFVAGVVALVSSRKLYPREVNEQQWEATESRLQRVFPH